MLTSDSTMMPEHKYCTSERFKSPEGFYRLMNQPVSSVATYSWGESTTRTGHTLSTMDIMLQLKIRGGKGFRLLELGYPDLVLFACTDSFGTVNLGPERLQDSPSSV